MRTALSPGEAWTLIERRLNGRQPSARCPRVEKDALTQLEGLNREDQNTIGWVVQQFRRIYERRASGDPRYTDLESVNYEEIIDLLMRGSSEGQR